MNHKRGKSKRRRAGCLMCKPWKAKLTPKKDRQSFSETRAFAGHKTDYGLDTPR